MRTSLNLSIILLALLLTSCVNQNKKIAANIMPTTNPCTKLNLLKNAYNDDFQSIKEMKVGARTSNIWRAKYQLFGQDCQVFSWGGSQQTYSCRLKAPDEESAKQYYQNAKTITQQCLGETWGLDESERAHDDGVKTIFTNTNENVSFSTHLVPTSGLFSTSWTLYYYVGNNKEPTTNSH